MKRTKLWIVGIACGVLCAICVFMYLQDAGASQAEGATSVPASNLGSGEGASHER